MKRPEGTWLSVAEAAQYAHCTEKAMRRRIERGTVVSVVEDADGQSRRVVLMESLLSDAPRPGEPAGNAPQSAPLGALGHELQWLMSRLEAQAEQLGKYRLLEEQTQSTVAAAQQEATRAEAARREAVARAEAAEHEAQELREQLARAEAAPPAEVKVRRRWFQRQPA